MRRELLTLSDTSVNNIEIGDICWVNYPYEEDSQKDNNGDSTWGKLRPALVINKNINEDRPLFVLKGTTSHNQFYNQSENIRYIDGMRFNCNSIAMLKPHHFLGFIDHIDFHDQRFQNILKTAYELDKHNRLVFSTYEDYIMNTDRRLINILNEANDKSIIKSNCTWKEVYAIYNTLLPHEKLYLGNRFIDSPNTVFRWIVKRNTENAGFIMLYDMKRPGSHRGELIVTVAIWEKYRGMGVLQELQAAAEKFVSSSSKYNRLIWYAKDANKKSIHCAEKLGYTKKLHELDHWVFDKTIKNKKSLESNSNELNIGKNIDISLTDYKTCKSIYEKKKKKDKIAINAYGTSTVFSDGDEVVKRYCCTIDTVPVGFMEYSRYNDGYTYISIVILSKYRGKPYNIANRFITLAKMDNTSIRYVVNKKNIASQKFIEKHPEFKLADKTRDCYVYEYQKPKSNNNDKELIIEEFNKQLNDADYGKVIYSEINSIPVQESNNMPMVFSEDDVYCNMSKFRNPYNIIFVCGTSGSGKSTLSKYLSDVHNATYVSLDHIMFWINRKPRTDMEVKLFDPTIYKYYKEKGILFDELVEICNSKNRKFFDYAKNRILDYIEWLSNQDEQFIIEGIQTSWVYNKNKFIVYPFIFKGTSMIKSWIRRAMREKDFFYKFDLKIALKWSSEWKRDINRIRNAVMLKTTDIYTRKEVYVNNETAKNSM